MADNRQPLRQREERKAEPAQTLIEGHVSAGRGEMSEVEVLIRAAESRAPVEPSLEGWTRFNERLMMGITESLERVPTRLERRRRLVDRLTASDSRLKDNLWVIVGLVIVAVLGVAAYFLYDRLVHP